MRLVSRQALETLIFVFKRLLLFMSVLKRDRQVPILIEMIFNYNLSFSEARW